MSRIPDGDIKFADRQSMRLSTTGIRTHKMTGQTDLSLFQMV